MKLSSNVAGDSSYENNFPHKLLLTNAQVSKLWKAFANNSSANIMLPKTQLHKIEQAGRLSGRLLESLFKIGFPLIWNVLKPLAKSILIPIGLAAAAAAAATDAAVQKKMFESGWVG